MNAIINYPGLALLPFFDAWLGFSGSIPDAYWNTWSEEQRFKWLSEQLCKLVEYSNCQTNQINANREDIEALAAELATIKEDFADDFEEYFKARICEWLQRNLACVIGNAVKFVQFGLTDSGRFVAYITDNWDFLQFDTIMQPGEDFGKLKIVY